MKKLSILLVFALLLGCLFLVACGSTPDNGDGGQTGGGEQPGGGEGGNEEASGYTVYVKDQFGNAMTGVNLQICHGDLALGNCLKPKDVDANGKAFYSYDGTLENARVQINTVPENVDKPTEYIFFEGTSKTLEITLNIVQKITVNATDLSGKALAYINVSVYKTGDSDAILVETKETDENGACEFLLDPAEYYLVFEPKNDAFALTNGDSEGDNQYSLKANENNFTAIFSESTSSISYTVTVKDANSTPLENIAVTLYNTDYTQIISANTDANGKVVVPAVNGDYFAIAEVGADKNAQVYIFEKNNSNKGEIIVYNVAAGGLKSNAIMIVGHGSFTVEAGKTQWIYVYNPSSEVVIFENNEGLTISGDGTLSDNIFSFGELDSSKGYIKVVNNGTEAITYTAVIGSEH